MSDGSARIFTFGTLMSGAALLPNSRGWVLTVLTMS